MSTAKVPLAATCLAMISWAAFANVSLNCVDAVKPCAHIDIVEVGGHASVKLTGCTATPSQHEFTAGRLRYEGGVTNDVWRQFVDEGLNGLNFGETIVKSGTGLTKGASRSFRINPGYHTGSMIIRGSIGTQSNFSLRCH